MNKVEKFGISGIVAGVILILIFGFIFITDIQEENHLFKTILITDADFSANSIDGQMAEQLYLEAGYSYEDGDYNSVERNCRLAREYFLKESQGYKKIKAELIGIDLKDALIITYIKILTTQVSITNNMFEACEHFESAARYYDTYYNTDVSYDDMSFAMGGTEIDMMNEKIRSHDINIEIYNNLLEEYRFELNSRLGI